ncbi:hypothetical protein COCVIDRAFT_110649, partial [Bipolaris victoriae FI3]
THPTCTNPPSSRSGSSTPRLQILTPISASPTQTNVHNNPPRKSIAHLHISSFLFFCS